MKREYENKAMQENQENKAIEAMGVCYHERTTEIKTFDGKTAFFLCHNCKEQL
jgi:hypothetical protein